MNTVAVYAGSFNPFHIGHLNIVHKAQRIFGRGNVIVARGQNPDKVKIDHDGAGNQIVITDDFNGKLEKRIQCPVYSYYGFLHDFLNTLEDEGINAILLRGLRNATDLIYEENQLKFIKEFKPNLRTIFMMCDPEHNHISSSAIRNMNAIKPGSGDRYIVEL